VIQSCIRGQQSVWYNYTIATNLKFKLYFDGELVLAKDDLQNSTISFVEKFMTKNEIVDLELYIVDDSMV